MPDDARDSRVVIDCPRCKRTHWAAGVCPACDGLVLLRPAPAAEPRDELPAAGRPAGRSIRRERP